MPTPHPPKKEEENIVFSTHENQTEMVYSSLRSDACTHFGARVRPLISDPALRDLKYTSVKVSVCVLCLSAAACLAELQLERLPFLGSFGPPHEALMWDGCLHFQPKCYHWATRHRGWWHNDDLSQAHLATERSRIPNVGNPAHRAECVDIRRNHRGFSAAPSVGSFPLRHANKTHRNKCRRSILQVLPLVLSLSILGKQSNRVKVPMSW